MSEELRPDAPKIRMSKALAMMRLCRSAIREHGPHAKIRIANPSPMQQLAFPSMQEQINTSEREGLCSTVIADAAEEFEKAESELSASAPAPDALREALDEEKTARLVAEYALQSWLDVHKEFSERWKSDTPEAFEKLRGAAEFVSKHMSHGHSCTYNINVSNSCDCGMDVLRAALSSAAPSPSIPPEIAADAEEGARLAQEYPASATSLGQITSRLAAHVKAQAGGKG